jgi:hypothetical protein
MPHRAKLLAPMADGLVVDQRPQDATAARSILVSDSRACSLFLRLAVLLHVVVGLSDGTTRGGHILEAHVWPTLEVIVVESPQHLQRRTDPETGLALISL